MIAFCPPPGTYSGMKNSVSTLIAKFFAIGTLFLAPVIGRGYDTPDFESPAFSRDGIMLADSERDSILSALASLASNFAGSSRVDSDLKEKALAIALTLDPLNESARGAHAALLAGETPARTPDFDTLSAISETLWSGAENLLQVPVEPENTTLAAYLIELSLLTHTEPPKERLVVFADVTGKKPLPWKSFLLLQPGTNPSSRKSGDLALNLAKIKTSPRPTPARKQPDSNDPSFFGIGNDKPDMKPASDFTPVTKSMYSVLYTEAVDGKPMAGEITLEVRPPANGEEIPNTDVPLIGKDAEGVILGGLGNSSSVNGARGWSWPAGVIGLLDFETEGALPGPARVTTVEVFLPSMILAESAFDELEPNQNIVLAGAFDSVSSPGELKGELLPTINAASELQKPYLALPDSAYEGLVQFLAETEQLNVLFAVEMVSYSTFEEAFTLMTNPVPDALTEASQAFSEIEAVAARMAFVDLARNAKVQERLESILALYPGHLSAKAMLNFGRAPEEGVMTSAPTEGSVTGKIDAAIKPFLQLETNNFDINELRGNLGESQLTISRLRAEMALDTRDYYSAAEDLLDSAEVFLGLTNQTTSTANQRLRETRQAIADLEAERRALGLEPFEED